MNHDYRPNGPYEAAVDKTRCRESVWHPMGNWGRFTQCRFKPQPGKDRCRAHSPEAAEQRRIAADLRYAKKRERDPLSRALRRAEKYEAALRAVLTAWDATPDGHLTPELDDAIEAARAALLTMPGRKEG